MHLLINAPPQVKLMLATKFGHSTFRPLQREVINACLAGKDVFAVLPTGAGKVVI